MEGDPYRALKAVEPDPYLAAWADLRRRRRAVLISAAAYLLGALALSAIRGGPRQALVLALFAQCAAVTAWAGGFRCPCCGERFSRGRRDGLLNRWCAACRIGIGTPAPGRPPP